MGNLLKLKFKESDFAGKDISSLSDTPSADGMSAKDLKAHFDLVPKILIAMGKYNELLDELDENGAEAIGLTETISELRTNIQRLFDMEHPKTLAETERAQNEIARIQAETERVRAENERKTAEEKRTTNEWNRTQGEIHRNQAENMREFKERLRQNVEDSRILSENSRLTHETERDQAEARRAAEEVKRSQNEDNRERKEQERNQAEERRTHKIGEIQGIADGAKRVADNAVAIVNGFAGDEATRRSAENARVTAENERQQRENNRVIQDGLRDQAESDRVTAENARVQAESNRAVTERGRVEAETNRVNSEQTRVDNDNYRYSLEMQRQANEAVREENRQNFGYKGDWQNGAYKKYNMVSHKGKVYLANQDTSNEPPNADWVLLSSEGKSLRIGGKYDTVSALRSAYPNGDDRIYIVWGKLYAWTNKNQWEEIGEAIGSGGGIDKAELLKIINPELAKKANLNHTHDAGDIPNLLPVVTNHIKGAEIKAFLTQHILSAFSADEIRLLQSLGEQYQRIYEALDGHESGFGENIAELMEQMKENKALSEENFTSTDKDNIQKATQDLLKKVDKVTGKDLSTNDFTNEHKGFVDKFLPLTQDWGAFQPDDAISVFNTIMLYTLNKHDVSSAYRILSGFASNDWLGTILENKNKLKTLTPTTIVNDLTTGGANKALSAEQGKVLFQSVVDGKQKVAKAFNDGLNISKSFQIKSDQSFDHFVTTIERELKKVKFKIGDVIKKITGETKSYVNIPMQDIYLELGTAVDNKQPLLMMDMLKSDKVQFLAFKPLDAVILDDGYLYIENLIGDKYEVRNKYSRLIFLCLSLKETTTPKNNFPWFVMLESDDSYSFPAMTADKLKGVVGHRDFKDQYSHKYNISIAECNLSKTPRQMQGTDYDGDNILMIIPDFFDETVFDRRNTRILVFAETL